jgi:hypothetical protein
MPTRPHPPSNTQPLPGQAYSGGSRRPTPVLLTLSEVAHRLGRSVITLRRWHKAGLLPLVTINNRHYVEPTELTALLERHRRGRADGTI